MSVPIYSTDSEPYFARVPEDQLATALNSVGWQQCPPEPEYNAETQHAPEWSIADEGWVVRDKSPEEIAAAARKVWDDKSAFWAEFTADEKAAIIASTVPGILLLLEELRMWSGPVWSDDPRVISGLTGLNQLAILTTERRAAILAK